MGTKVQIDSYMPGHCSMRGESNGASWPPYYGDNNFLNGQLCYGFLPRTTSDSHPGYDKDVVKQTMLEHEAIFKNQVFELHRLYQVQRDLMDEVRRKDQIKCPIPYEGSSSSSPVPSQMQHEDIQRWNGVTPPLANFVISRPIPGTGTVQSSLNPKEKNIHAGSSPFQNCCSPKNSEASDSRPTKFRRKMLDLQLPADEYIDPDEVEQFGDAKVLNNMTPSPDKNRKLFLNYPVKAECHGDVSISDSHVTKSRAIADLNEPLHVEETTISSVGFLGAAPSHIDVQYRGPVKLLGSSKDGPHSSTQGSLNGNLNHSPFENGSNSRDRLCSAIESEQHKGSVRSINKGTPWTSSQPKRSLLDQLTQPPAFLTCDQIKGEPWKEKSDGNLEKSDRSYSIPNYNMPESILSSHAPNQPSLFYSSGLGKTWDQCGSSWSKPGAVSSQKLPVSNRPFLKSNALSKSHQSSVQSNDFFGNKWNLNFTPGNNAPVAGESSMKNGFYQGSSSSVKELPGRFPPNSFAYSEKSVPCSIISYVKPETCMNGRPVKDMNLNVPLSNGVSDDQTVEPDCAIGGCNQKSTDSLAVLPWLRGDNHTVKAEKPEISDFPNSRKILGVPIFEKSPTPKKENATLISSSAIHHQLGKEEVESSWRKGGFDMNLPCELSDSEHDTMNMEVIPTEKRTQNESASVRNHFDLNSCVTEEESPCGTTLRRDTGIDLEAPAMVESEEDVPVEKVHVSKEPDEKQPEIPPDRADNEEAELAKSAAELIVAISSSVTLNQSLIESTCVSPVEASEEEMLRWFVDVACSSGNDPESHMIPDHRDNNGDRDQDRLPEGLDDYESMILRLKECDVEEYFPKPSIPEFLNIEENGPCVLTTRTRRRHARRGRQRRDFQRDILPGLASLSRHEVTEDLQTLGGLMRATGHPWHSAPNRRNATRNGCGRGRRRSVVVAASALVETGLTPSKQISSSNTEVVLEDRCLTGWGKTTRRPRRQRCLAGNPPPPLPLS